jgi:hypothetical protein
MSGRGLFYLAIVVFIAGAIVLGLGLGATSTAATISGFVLWIISIVLLAVWFAQKSKTA